MLSYHRVPAVAEGVLLRVNQAVARTHKPSGVRRRALRRSLSKATSRIEQSADYQRSLAELSRSAQSFQSSLDREQLSRWLLVEEAILEHVACLERSYFYAGVACGERLEPTRPIPIDPPRSLPTPDPHSDTEALIALARLVTQLTQR